MKNMGLSVCLCPVISSVTVLFETDRKNWTAMMFVDHKIKNIYYYPKSLHSTYMLCYLDELSEMIGGLLTIKGTSAVSLSVRETKTWHYLSNKQIINICCIF